MIYSHVSKRPVAHHRAAVDAQAIDGINLLPLLLKKHVERYRGGARCSKPGQLAIRLGFANSILNEKNGDAG